ncbi:MAG: hypothetical protein J6D03_09655 [Clostridia bacterium]|nr:hypothetical protein [Clostridia bacterium]MBO5095620.1 hypothetical protein [Bacilli bacterium]MBP3920517.1 hypothetical protein [Bacilli bacterium]MBP3929339.1 hypothetical protein [Peptostreptococcaceae bacterium]MBQ9012637.1 hypothetical protein [Bacilli bacterium]
MNKNMMDKEVQLRGRLLAEKFEKTGILTFEDFDLAMKSLEDQEEEKVFVCDKCGFKHEIEYTQVPLIKGTECSCGNQIAVQIYKGSIIWKMPSMK